MDKHGYSIIAWNQHIPLLENIKEMGTVSITIFCSIYLYFILENRGVLFA